MEWRERARGMLERIPGGIPAARLVSETVSVALRYRATGLAAEAAFFTLLSLPPLILALVAGAGYVSRALGEATIDRVSDAIENWSLTFLTAETVESIIVPTINDTFNVGRGGLLSLGFVIALWSGSRVMHIFFDTISIMYGQGGERGMIKARLLSLGSYVVAMLGMAILLPLLLIGPTLLRSWLPYPLEIVVAAYWPVVSLLGLLGLTMLFHFATPYRSPYIRDLPGALVTVAFWLGSSVVIRTWALRATGSWTLFGPLTAPIVLMVYLYFLAFAVLIGAATNAAIRRLWPPPEYHGPIASAGQWWRGRRERRRNETGHIHTRP